MAATLKLVRVADFVSDVDTTDLLSTSGFYLSDWVEQVIPEGEDSVVETISLRSVASNDDGLATLFQGLYTKFTQVGQAKDRAERYQIYLRDQLTAETAARRAIVLSIRGENGMGLHSFLVATHHKTKFNLAIERGHWEADTFTSQTPANISGVGGLADTYAVTGTPAAVPGDLSARLRLLSFVPHAGSGAISEIWWGFRTARHCTLANWFGLWQLELGTAGTDTALATDATASPGGGGNTKLQCNFDTVEAMASRVTLTPYQLSNSNYADLRGTYQIVARLRVDSGYICQVKIGYGLPSGSFTYRDPITVDSTSNLDYDLGQITLPAGGPSSPYYSTMKSSTIDLQAQLYSGTQDNGKYLHMDCLQAVPVDEGYGHLSGGAGVQGLVLIDALGRIEAYDGTDLTNTLETRGTNPKNCVVPPGLGKIIVVAQQAAISVLADAVDLDYNFHPRYRGPRGGG